MHQIRTEERETVAILVLYLEMLVYKYEQNGITHFRFDVACYNVPKNTYIVLQYLCLSNI